MAERNSNGCGVKAHHAECLCDVEVTETAPIAYGLHEIWHMDLIMRTQNYGPPYTSADLAGMLEALAKGYDATRQVAGIDNRPEGLGLMRDELLGLLQRGHSIIDMPDTFNIPWGQVLMVLTDNVPSVVWTWDEQTWAKAETMITDPDGPSVAEFRDMMGVTRGVAAKMFKWYGQSGGVSAKKKRSDELTALIREHAHRPPAEVVDEVWRNGFADVTAREIWKRRRAVLRGPADTRVETMTA